MTETSHYAKILPRERPQAILKDYHIALAVGGGNPTSKEVEYNLHGEYTCGGFFMPKMPEMPDNKPPLDKRKQLVEVLAKMAKNIIRRESSAGDRQTGR